MKTKECLAILTTMAFGSSRKEREAVKYAEKKIKQAKKYKEMLNQGCNECRYDEYKYQAICKYCSHTYINQFERKQE